MSVTGASDNVSVFCNTGLRGGGRSVACGRGPILRSVRDASGAVVEVGSVVEVHGSWRGKVTAMWSVERNGAEAVQVQKPGSTGSVVVGPNALRLITSAQTSSTRRSRRGVACGPIMPPDVERKRKQALSDAKIALRSAEGAAVDSYRRASPSISRSLDAVVSQLRRAILTLDNIKYAE